MMKSILPLIFLFAGVSTRAQEKISGSASDINFQYGYGIKVLIEIGHQSKEVKPKDKPLSYFSIAANAGVASNFIVDNIHPSFNIDLLCYKGGLGSKRPGDNSGKKIHTDVVTAFTLTAGVTNLWKATSAASLQYRNVPLYYFGNFTMPTLQNPFDYSLSFGTNFIFTTDPHKKKQRIGFFNLHADAGYSNAFQLSYYNDGGWPNWLSFLGDEYDRYYTGGAVLSYHGPTNTVVNLIELSFHKFTGYTKNAFEASNQLDLGFVNYRREEQKFYNKSLWTITAANPIQGWGVNVRSYDWDYLDLQHGIHKAIFDSFHLVPYQPHAAVSGQYYWVNNNISLR